MRKVLVVGSTNIDISCSVNRFPEPGETLMCEQMEIHCGGKGANQAVAAARLGAEVAMIGAVGNDGFAQKLINGLKQENINTDAITIIDNVDSGIANIITCFGENQIIVSQGANRFITPEHILANEHLFEWADIILSQMEIPLTSVETTAALAEKHKKPFILNPAPACHLPKPLLEKVSLLTPNEHEFIISLDLSDTDVFGLFSFVTENVLMTRGVEGAYFYNPERGGVDLQPSFHVTAVDSTGAGDTFNGAIAVYHHLGITEAVKRACAAAAMSVCHKGAQNGMPTEDALLTFIEQQTQSGNSKYPMTENRLEPLIHQDERLFS